MKILSAEIENFMAISTAKVELADRGLVLIQGENSDESSADSNGAGKSSLADAIAWCLYGITARGEDTDKVVNRFTKGGTRVQVLIEDGGEQYTITRHRKHTKGKNTLTVWKSIVGVSSPAGSVGTDLTKGTEKLTQAEIDKIVGCSHEVFCGAVYAGQERMPDLPGMTDKNLKMLIEEASGATLLETAYKEANTRVTKAKTEHSAAESRKETAAFKLKNAEENLAKAETNQVTFENDRKRAMAELAVQGKAVKSKIDALEAEHASKRPIADIRLEIEKYDEAIAGVAGEREQERVHNNTVNNARRVLEQRVTDARILKRSFDTEKKEHDDLDHKVGCNCHACDRPFSAEDIAPAKKLAAKKMNEIADEYTKATSEEIKAKAKLEAAEAARDAFVASMSDLTKINAARIEAQNELTEAEARESKLTAMKSELQGYVRQIKTKRDEANPFTDQIEKNKKDIEEGKLFLEQATNDVKNAETEVKTHELVAKVFSPAGVRAFLLDEVTPFLNAQTAKYLGTLSDGNITATWTTLVKTAKGELKEKFSIEVENANGGETFKGISGGEKRKVRIACALALQDLVARRATKPIELFIGDEIDDALDPAGIQRLTDILNEKAKERGSVFVISHSDLKDWVRNVITVKRSGLVSTIEESVS